MKKWKLPLCALLVVALLAAPLIGCSEQAAEETPDDAEFSYSLFIDENGYWEGVKALDYVTLSDYQSIEIPSSVHKISDEAIQGQIDSFLSSYSTTEQETDRAVADGDTVNMDYVGTIDGVAFEGGTNKGAAATIGVTSYIDGFLEQLIGHMPGETFDIEVTFPDNYQKTELAGKNAVFNITLNYISKTVTPELTDAFVAEKLSESYGLNTVAELKADISSSLQDQAIQSYLKEQLVEKATVASVPDKIISYQEKAMVKYYEDSAESYGVALEDLLTSYVGVDSIDALIEASADTNLESATYSLILQAIAEDQGFVPSDDDVKAFFADNYGTDDYSQYEEQYGMPYLKQIVLSKMVLDYLTDNAKLAS